PAPPRSRACGTRPRRSSAASRRSNGACHQLIRVLCPTVRCLAAAIAAALVAVLAASTAALGAADPYQHGDYKGFLNILPPGENGFDNGQQLLDFETSGTRPKHSDDQLAMYGDLVHVAPQLGRADIGKYYKDARFGVKPGDVDRQYSPLADVTLLRDK